MHATTIIAWTFNADTYCDNCIIDVLDSAGLVSPAAHNMNTHDVIDQVIHYVGGDPDDLYSYDSDDAPKPVFVSQIESDDEYCGACYESLLA